jgi:glycosyltransferase involved in cell wall biosynthesis
MSGFYPPPARSELQTIAVKIFICSTLCAAPWGGSEELWSRAAAVLLRRKHTVCISYPFQSQLPPQVDKLRKLGAQTSDCPERIFRWPFRRQSRPKKQPTATLEEWVRKANPDLMLVSMSWHLDNLSMTQICRDLGIPYCLLIEAASPNVFLSGERWDAHRAAFSCAAKCFFVSEQNRDLMEANLGLDLSPSQIVDNPFCVNPTEVPAWPKSEDPWKLACVGRIDFQSKGQDVLLQALRRSRWRNRRLEITLFGADFGNERQVRSLIDLYGLHHQVKLGGYIDNIAKVWRSHHGLVLSSRSEGNALALVEAMMCHRVPIVTHVGRAASLIDDNVSGFIAPAATVDLIDDALERAWQRRDKWRLIGEAAGKTIRQRHSLRPADDFADALLSVAGESSRRSAA